MILNIPVNLFASGASVIGSRAINTVYQNTGNTPRLVICGGIDAVNSSTGEIGSSNPPTITCAAIPNSLATVVMTFIVPPGWYYRLASPGMTLTLWFEMN